MAQDSCSYEYNLDDTFFKDIEAPEVRKGALHVQLDVQKFTGGFILDFHTVGTVVVPCDRCLDDMDMPVDTRDTLKVKLGSDFADEEEWVTVPEEEGYIDVSWFLYEFIVLSLPMQHTHEPGECNQEMMDVLSQHLCTEESEFSDEEYGQAPESGAVDPRWNELKKIVDNN